MSDNLDESSSISDEPCVSEDEFKNFTEKLDQFTPIIPETVTEYYMKQSGLQTDDERVVKLLSASVQKFVSGIVNDCYQLHKLREKSTNKPVATATNTAATAAASAPPQPTTEPVVAVATTATTTAITTDQSGIKKPVVQTNQTLTLNDLTYVLDEYGINVKKTFYYT